MTPTNSLERVLAVLDVFSEKRLEWTFEELMDELGYSRPTLYRYLKTLKDAGFLASTHGAGYTLGPRIVELDYLVRKSDALVLAGAPSLRNLAGRRPCTAFLVRWYGAKILCVASESSTDRLTSSYPRGRPMPLGRGAIARSIMAYLPRANVTRLIRRNFEELRSVGLGESEDEIRKNIARVRKTGYAVAHGEVTPGAIGVASAILDAAGHPVASCCVVVAGNLVTGAMIDCIGEEVRDTAGLIRDALVTSE
jgi:DNA-binding IclR family transcriptional regulator